MKDKKLLSVGCAFIMFIAAVGFFLFAPGMEPLPPDNSSGKAYAAIVRPNITDVIVDGVTINWYPDGKLLGTDENGDPVYGQKIYAWLVWRVFDSNGDQVGGSYRYEVGYNNLDANTKAAIKQMINKAWTYARTQIDEAGGTMPGLPE